MSLTSFQLVELMHRALAEPTGIEVKTNDVQRLRNKLYLARSDAKNPEFEVLTFLPSRTQPDTHLWLVKNAKAQNG